MIQIYKPLDSLIKMLGEQKVKETEYRNLTYIHYCNHDDGMLLYNVLTREFLFLTDAESKEFLNKDMNSQTIKELIKKWFVVPVNNDDYLLFNQADSILNIVADSDVNAPITTFAIFPTTDCNARCFYCFELGCKRINMTEQTAHDVANYIIRKSCGKSVHLCWFGGEPLYNIKVIDIITRDLKKKKIDYYSTMVSNGYLFDDNIVKQSVNKWNLKKIQITLDGTEEIYNKTKAYIYKNIPSPFYRVLNNIELLLKEQVSVHVRLNMNENNCDNLKELICLLSERFKQYNEFMVYIRFIVDFKGYSNIPKKEEKKLYLYKKYHEINEFMREKGKGTKYLLNIYRKVKQCMADSNTTTTILPDGSLGKCEHYTDDNFYGSIYSDEIDRTVINKFKEKTDLGKQCYNCAFLPSCRSLKACPNRQLECVDIDKQEAIYNTEDYMKNTYNEFISNKNFNNNDVLQNELYQH